jgi:hypothetical protein
MDGDDCTTDTGMLSSDAETPDPAAARAGPTPMPPHLVRTTWRPPRPCPTPTLTAPARQPRAWPRPAVAAVRLTRRPACLIAIPTMACSASWSRSPSGCSIGVCPWPGSGCPRWPPYVDAGRQPGSAVGACAERLRTHYRHRRCPLASAAFLKGGTRTCGVVCGSVGADGPTPRAWRAG